MLLKDYLVGQGLSVDSAANGREGLMQAYRPASPGPSPQEPVTVAFVWRDVSGAMTVFGDLETSTLREIPAQAE